MGSGGPGQHRTQSSTRRPQMGMLDGLLGGIVGAGMVSVVNNIIDKHGGLQGVVKRVQIKRPGRDGQVVGRHRPQSSDLVRGSTQSARARPAAAAVAEIRPVGTRPGAEARAGATPGRRYDDAGRHDPEGVGKRERARKKRQRDGSRARAARISCASSEPKDSRLWAITS